MGLRTRAILLGVASYLASPLGLALGLGEIKMNSHLNQPLEAEIQLLQTRELSAQEILVGLGTREDFERVGVDRPFFLNDLKFTVDMESPNGPVIRVKSNRLVKEPFLNFIVQAQWPSGKLLREYTVLLDLPVFTKEPARAVQAAKAQAPARQPVTQTRTPARQPAPRQSSGFDGDTYGPVSSTDTLWAIASKAKPGDEFSVQQTMLAIQRLNPNAFINNNINLLKRGAVLRLPSETDITDFDPRQAKREVASQNRNVKAGAPAAQIDASRSNVERGQAAEQVQGRVKLTSASDITGSKSGSGSGEGEQDSEALRTQLLSTQEELAATKRENADLNARVLAMDEQVKTMEKLLDVASADMRKLELALQEQQKQEALAVDDGAVDASTAEDTDSAEVSDNTTEAVVEEAAEAAATTSEAQEAPSSEPAVEAAPVKPEPVKAVEPPAAKKKSFMDIIMENLIFIGGALVLLIGGLVYFLLTRNSGFDDDDEFDYDESAEPNDDPIAASSEHDGALDDVTVAQFDSNDDTVLERDLDTTEPEITLDSLGSQLLDDDNSKGVLESADNHIALGEYDEALAVLDGATQADPSEVQLKRLEIFAKQDNLEAFDGQFAAFEESATPAQVERAQDFRGLISSAMLGAGVAALDQESEPDFDELDTTLQFDAVSEADIEAAAAKVDTSTDDTVLDVGDIDNTVLDDSTEEFSLDDLDTSLELDLDDESDDLEADLEALAAGSEPSEESVSEDLDFSALSDDSTQETESFDLEASALELDLEDDAELSLDLSDDDTVEIDADLLDGASLGDDLDIELRESNVEEDNDELDLTNLAAPSSATSSAAALELSLDDDALSLDDGLSLGDDLGVDDLSLEDLEDESTDTAELSVADDEVDDLDVDLDSLDQDLDQLASDFEGDLAELDDALENDDALTTVEPEALTDVSVDAEDVTTLVEQPAADVELPAFDPDSDDDSEPGFLGDSDEVATKIDLLRVFVDMGDTESALNTLEEIREEGNDAQKQEAESLFAELG
ncbi:FimV/HubP family polar landmark protein [Marinagarivorans cellulosilyticus]|uniref:Pilus assembly protein FimV n=1 Tax=Marinagarivorans cellulosilyticus TaxID=2721545 RepID=A0AAN1WFN2_9GAMM|nr:FimV/HubP family polar landmark protein [Marinagarivorans cellulosilyticus]BCD96730.1 pilus assembly protein FimV [Marinagarivorans cellulosilyticus]